jgi:hypothetical protein
VRVLPHERRPDSLERLDAALFAAIGLVAVCGRLDALLHRYGRPSATRASRAPSPSLEDESVLLALVGLVALRRACGEHLEALAADGRATRTDATPKDAASTRPAGRPESARSWLR